MMIMGTIMILCALSLLLYNRKKEETVGKRSDEVLKELEALMDRSDDISDKDSDYSELESGYSGEDKPFLNDKLPGGSDRKDNNSLPDGVIDGDIYSMLVDGHYYIGILNIPVMSVTLPVQWGWSDELMDTSPCRYNGTFADRNIIIMAHNYSTHFGRLFDLSVGDKLSFTDVLGVKTEYEVCGIDVFGRSEVHKMYEGDWDMTLFTCVPNTYNRIAVRCKIIEE